MTTLSSRLEKNWRAIIGDEFEQRMAQLEQFLQREKDLGRDIYPKDENIFNALNSTAFKDIKVVIIGQDPYHREGQAHGLCFSVPKDIKKNPPSLRNIYEEIKRDCRVQMPSHGDLTGWAEQGVLLLNGTLTVQHASPGSHKGKGWEKLTDAIICAVSERREHVVFLLWGRCAREKAALIKGKKHLVLEASHPSPFSVYRGSRDAKIHSFHGCGHFKKTNKYLVEHGLKPVEWEKI
jgi:uracil-DNA glycosylase